MKQTLTVFSPAKVNLQLEIGERRTDGFHQAKSIMQALTLHDMVTVVLDDGVDAYLSPDGFSDFAIDVTCTTFEGIPELDVAPESNIAYKAAAALAEKLGHEQGHISIHIEKHIPFEAGLGGGAANAAARTEKSVSRVERWLFRKCINRNSFRSKAARKTESAARAQGRTAAGRSATGCTGQTDNSARRPARPVRPGACARACR